MATARPGLTWTGPALALLGGSTLLASFWIDPDPDGGQGARTFPLIGAGALLLLGALETLTTHQSKAETPVGLVRILLLLALALGYVFGIGGIGYLAATAIAAPLVLVLFGRRRPRDLLAAAALCPIAYHLVFFVGLGVFPPYGAWFDLADLWR